MKRSKFTEAQIAFAIKQAETGTRVEEVCRKMVAGLVSDYRISLRRACNVSLLSTSVWYRYGIERIVVLLKREGWKDNHKRVYRIYKEEGLNLRVKRPRRCRAASHRSERPVFSNLHDCWSMDFVADALFDSGKIRCLTIVDNYSRKCMAIQVGQRLKGGDVVAVLEGLRVLNGEKPKKNPGG